MLCCHSKTMMKSSFTFSPCGCLKSIFVNYSEFTDQTVSPVQDLFLLFILPSFFHIKNIQTRPSYLSPKQSFCLPSDLCACYRHFQITTLQHFT